VGDVLEFFCGLRIVRVLVWFGSSTFAIAGTKILKLTGMMLQSPDFICLLEFCFSAVWCHLGNDKPEFFSQKQGSTYPEQIV